MVKTMRKDAAEVKLKLHVGHTVTFIEGGKKKTGKVLNAKGTLQGIWIEGTPFPNRVPFNTIITCSCGNLFGA